MYLSILKEEEKELFLSFAYHLANADGDYCDEEREMFKAYCFEMSISKKEEDINLTVDETIDKIAEISDMTAKKIIIFEITGLALVDKNYDDSERRLVKKAIEKFEVDKNFALKCEEYLREYLKLQDNINELVLG